MSNQVKAIDVWMQHPTPSFIGHPMFESLRRWMGMGDSPPEIPLEFTVQAMEQADVEKGLLSAWWGPQGPLIKNDEVAAWIEQYPDRFAGLAAVNLLKPMDAVRELRRCTNDLGFKGLRIVQWLWNLPATDRHYYPLFAECINLGVPVCLQVGHTGPLCPSEPGRPIPYIDEIALAFPELVIVCGHIGYPWTQEMIAVATKHPNVYIDTSAYKAKRFPAELVTYMRGNGAKKVLFGTNYPMMTPQMAFDGLESLGLDEKKQSMYLRENALRIFSL